MKSKKKTIIALAAVMALAVAGTSLAVATNPFDDVPAKHWAYDSIESLARAGVITGYNDGTFKGEKTLTRYEMAVIVAKAMSKSKSSPLDQEAKETLDKLKTEFGEELKSIGVRVDNLEKTSPSLKITADARLRYLKNNDMQGNSGNSIDTSYMQERVRLTMAADVADNVKFIGLVVAENTSNQRLVTAPSSKISTTDKLHFDQAEILWTNRKFSLSAGRIMPVIGQGLLWCVWPIDGVYATYDFGKVAVSGGYGDLNTYGLYGGSTVNVAMANLAIKASDSVTLTAAYLDSINPKNVTTWNGYNYNFNQFSYGANAKLGEFTLTAEGIRNNAADLPENAQKTGWWTSLLWKGIDLATPGSYGVTLDYMKLGNWAVDSEQWGHALYVPGGNGIGGDGAKGYGVTFNYVVAKNIDVKLEYYKLKPYDSNKAGFDEYKNFVGITTNFKF